MENTKITAKEMYNAMRNALEGMETVDNLPTDEVLEFIDKKVAQLDAKAAKARERAEAKKVEGDELREAVLAQVTEDFQTADAITEALGDETISKSKVVARLTQLVRAGLVQKEQAKVDGSKKMTYALAGASCED